MGKYVESNLGNNETIVFSATRTGLCLFGTWVKGILLCWLLLIPLIKAIIATVAYFKSELVITNQRVVGKTGLVNTKAVDAPLDKVQSVTTTSGFWGKIFGFGTVTISSAADTIVFPGVKNPDDFKKKLLNQIETYNQK